MWPVIAQAGLTVLGGILGGSAQRRAARTQEKLTKAQTYADNVTREANNISRSAENSLAEYVRTLNNQRQMKAAGEQYNYLGENLARVMDANAKGNFNQRIQAAEQAGAIAAQTAWAGIGGSTADLINGTMSLRNAIIEEETKANQGQMTYDSVRKQVGVVSAGIDNIDFRQSIANVDMSTSLEKYTHKPGWDSIFTNTALAAAPALLTGLSNWMDSKNTGVRTVDTSSGILTGPAFLVGTTASRLKIQ